MKKTSKKSSKNKSIFLILQKVSFYVFLVFLALMFLVSSVTKLQLLPFLIFVALGYFSIYQKIKNINIAIVVLSVFMILINITIPSPSIIDIILWLMGLSFIKANK